VISGWAEAAQAAVSLTCVPRNCCRASLQEERRGRTPKCSQREGRVQRHKNGSRSAQFRLDCWNCLRVYARAGESLAQSLVALVQSRRAYARALGEIDDEILGKVTLGQNVIIQPKGWWKKFSGTVASISAVMGRRGVTRRDPSTRSTATFYEAVITNPRRTIMNIGLEGTVQFLSKACRNGNYGGCGPAWRL